LQPTPRRLSCIGASAGGLEALETFFTHLSPQTGFAFIVVTHQQPGHISLLPDLLKNFTKMPVLSALDGMALKKTMFLCVRPEKIWLCLTAVCI
jgi:two-component system CheB/CheR fusion protein